MPRRPYLIGCALLLALAAVPGTWQGCAHMEAPPGGPADSTRPFLAEVYPAPGAVNVSRKLDARLGFSEWLDPDAERGKVHLSPAPRKRLRVELKGDRIEISTSDPLDSNTTYVLGVLGTLKDLKGWPLESPYQLVFSTGPTLDSAQVEGRLAVFPGTRPPAGAFAALYPHGAPLRARFGHLPKDSAGRIDSLPDPAKEKPAYLAAADSLGRFAFVGLRPGAYMLMGFQDAGSNLLPNFGSEALGIGRTLIVPGGAPPSLALAPYDTLPARLLEARWVGETVTGGLSRGTLRLRFSRPPLPAPSLRREACAVRQAKDGGPVPILDAGQNPDGELELETRALAVGDSFRVACAGVRDLHGNPLDTARDEAPFIVGTAIDTTPARPVFLGPRRASGLREPLVTENVVIRGPLTAYYPKLLTDSALADLRKRLEVKLDTVRLAASLARVNHHELALTLPPGPHRGKRISIGFRAPDMGRAAGPPGVQPGKAAPAQPGAKPDSAAGRPAADTSKARAPAVSPVATLTLADSAALGSLAFRQEPSAQGGRLLIRPWGGQGEVARVTPKAAEFKVDSLPAGWYAVSIFRDADGDGVWSTGRLRPWMPQEPFRHYADSVEVKAGATSDAKTSARPGAPGDLRLP